MMAKFAVVMIRKGTNECKMGVINPIKTLMYSGETFTKLHILVPLVSVWRFTIKKN